VVMICSHRLGACFFVGGAFGSGILLRSTSCIPAVAAATLAAKAPPTGVLLQRGSRQVAAHLGPVVAEAVHLVARMEESVLRRGADQRARMHQGNRLAQLAVPWAEAQLAALEAVQRQLGGQRQV